ncbi:hypothetical protein RUM44_007065 [Polyplax serrata]|uniref:C2H2-type domain-containing protein n=1 Tax=Polyplax serrata TaxID=468196 RepID=A0ABR1AZN1_POLSC
MDDGVPGPGPGPPRFTVDSPSSGTWNRGWDHPRTTDNKPVCPECGKAYSNNSNLKQHLANVHASPQQLETCQVCNKQFKTRQYLQVHLLASHGIRQRKSPAPLGFPPWDPSHHANSQ